VRGIFRVELQQPLEQIGQRKERRIFKVWNTPTLQAHMRLVGHMVLEHLHEATLTNASFPAQEHHVPMSCLGLFPAFQEEPNFLLSPDQGGQAPGRSHIETSSSATFLEDTVHVEGLSNASERLCSQVLVLEIALDQSIGHFTNGNRIGCSQSFNARSNIGYFS